MSIFKKRETIVGTLAYMSIMVAINAVFVLLTTLVPFLLFLLVFVLPLTHAIVTIYCKKRFYPIYFVATLGICTLVTLWNFSDTFFYVLPSLVTGFIFGLLIEKKVSPILAIMVSTFIQIGFTYLSLPLIKLIFNIDMIAFFLKVFGLESFAYPQYIASIFITILSLGQMVITYIFLYESLLKMNVDGEPVFKDSWCLIGLNGILFSLATLFAFIYPDLTFMFLILTTPISLYFAIELIKQSKKLMPVLLGISLLIALFLTAGLYKTIANYSALGLAPLFASSFLFTIIFLFNYLLNKNKVAKIEK